MSTSKDVGGANNADDLLDPPPEQDRAHLVVSPKDKYKRRSLVHGMQAASESYKEKQVINFRHYVLIKFLISCNVKDM